MHSTTRGAAPQLHQPERGEHEAQEARQDERADGALVSQAGPFKTLFEAMCMAHGVHPLRPAFIGQSF